MSLSCRTASLLICIKMIFILNFAESLDTPTLVAGNHQILIKMTDFWPTNSCKITVYVNAHPRNIHPQTVQRSYCPIRTVL